MKTPHNYIKRHRLTPLSILTALLCCLPVQAGDSPVKVYILSGQSNMVGIGQVDGQGSQWRNLVSDPVVSLYPGDYDPAADYDQMEPTQTRPVEKFGSNKTFSGEGTHIVRGFITVAETGIYEIRPGYGNSELNITTVGGQEIHRYEPGQENRTFTPVKLEGGKKTPFKTIYLNKNGGTAGYYNRVDLPGTLRTLTRKDGKFQHLVNDEGEFVPRDDVWYKGVVTATANKWLDVGCGATENQIGPELGFGHAVGDHHEAPVLIIKASQGNRSLGWDFLPPGSERFEYTDKNGTVWVYAGYGDPRSKWEKGTEPEVGGWYAGKQYDDCFNSTQDVLAHFDENFPHWQGRDYEIAGFVWWQGHKDGGESGTGSPTVHAMKYEENLVRLIQSLREKFEAPEAPFVVATCGFNGGEGWEPGSSADTIFNAQMNVGDPEKYPQFGGKVVSVDTRPFYRPPEVSPRNQSFHYHGNAETYMLVGEATGNAMVELMKKSYP